MASIVKDKRGRLRVLFYGADRKCRAVWLGRTTKKGADTWRANIEAIVAAQCEGEPLDANTARWRGTRGPRASAAGKGGTGVAAADRTGREDARRVDRRFQLVETEGEAIDVHVLGAHAAEPERPLRARLRYCDHHGGRRRGVRRLARSARSRGRRAELPTPASGAATQSKFSGSPGSGGSVKSVRRGSPPTCPTRTGDIPPREDAELVIDACPDAEWRLLFALSRFGGLRCPSEHLSLRWADVDWQRSRIRVRSPKTEHHPGGESRLIPIFPELLPFLRGSCDRPGEPSSSSPDTARRMQTCGRSSSESSRRPGCSLGRSCSTICVRPGRPSSRKSSRRTSFAHGWATRRSVARKHYLQMTEEHFERAANRATDQGSAHGGKRRQTRTIGDMREHKNPCICRGF